MKVNLIGMILNNAGRACFDRLVVDDGGKPLSAADSLHTLLMEYAKVMGGGKSDLVVGSREVMVRPTGRPASGDGVPAEGSSPLHGGA